MLNAQNVQSRKESKFYFFWSKRYNFLLVKLCLKKLTLRKGKLYISTRGGVTLCGACYRGGAKPELTFNVRERPGRALKPGYGLKYF